MTRGELARSLSCDVLALAAAGLFVRGLYLGWPPAAYLFSGAFLFWAAFVLRGRIK